MKYRSRIDVISQMLDAANGSGVTKSRLVYKTFLNYDQLKKNLMALIEKDLLRYNRNTRTFKTTEKGLIFLHIYSEINEMLKEDQPSPQKMRIYQ
jgi:predicted transcriptional regulator